MTRARHVYRTYRGLPEPKPTGNKKYPHSYVIHDGRFGYFTGSLEGVVDQWRNAVDQSLYYRALERDYQVALVAIDDPLLCKECGAMVGDVDTHDRWHGKIDEGIGL